MESDRLLQLAAAARYNRNLSHYTYVRSFLSISRHLGQGRKSAKNIGEENNSCCRKKETVQTDGQTDRQTGDDFPPFLVRLTKPE